MTSYNPAADPVHGHGFNTAARWGGWSWNAPSRGEHFRRCSFCGSIHPDDLAAEPAGTGCGHPGCPDPHSQLARVHFPVAGLAGDRRHVFVDTGWRASWADMKYGWPHKFYVEGLVNRDPSSLSVIGSASGPQAPSWAAGAGEQWVPVSRLTRQQRKTARGEGYLRSGDQGGWLLFGHRNTHFAKFYTIHLADPAIGEQTREIIARVSRRRLTFDDGLVSWQAYAPPETSP